MVNTDYLIRKQKHLIRTAKDNEERALLYGTWTGYIQGLRITNAITTMQYNKLEREIRDFYREDKRNVEESSSSYFNGQFIDCTTSSTGPRYRNIG